MKDDYKETVGYLEAGMTQISENVRNEMLFPGSSSTRSGVVEQGKGSAFHVSRHTGSHQRVNNTVFFNYKMWNKSWPWQKDMKKSETPLLDVERQIHFIIDYQGVHS